jgi:DNA-binding transcriptional LysR family regulator
MNMTNAARPLDLDAVQAFVLIADLCSFTRAADALDTTQAAVSLKLKRLEDRLGYRLVERTPRRVRVSGNGATFLAAARDLLAANERALAGPGAAPHRLLLGISDQVGGPDLPRLLARFAGYDPALVLEVRVAASHDLMAAFDQGELDAAILRSRGVRHDGERLTTDRMGWFAGPGWEPRPGAKLPLVALAEPCGVRTAATRLLDAACIPWAEAFIGGGVTAVAAAVMAGLGVAPLARRVAPPGAIEVAERLGLPPIPPSDVMLYANVGDPRARGALKTLAAAFRHEPVGAAIS